MINFKNQQDAVPSAIILCSILILVSTLLYELLAPKPNALAHSVQKARDEKELKKQVKFTKEQVVELDKKVHSRLWKGDTDAITATLLGKATTLAKQNTLGLTAFRPQKPQALEGVMELPFSIIVTGSFMAVQRMAHALEDKNNNVALRSLQVASADSATSNVMATINLSAYKEVIVPKTTQPTTRARKQ